MGISERQNEILKIIKDNVYVSVNELSKITFTSPSSIRRDLTCLENLGLVNRSYGGASLPEINGRVAGFYNRSKKQAQGTFTLRLYLYLVLVLTLSYAFLSCALICVYFLLVLPTFFNYCAEYLTVMVTVWLP